MMVCSNKGSPDPDNPSEDLSPNQEIVIADDTDTEDEETNNPYQDYQPLPFNEGADIDNNDEDEEDREEQNNSSANQAAQVIGVEEELVKEVWSGPSPKAVDIVMDNNKVDEVKKAMLNFSLPESAIPEWASSVPEDEWKRRLMDRLQNLKE